MDNLENALPRNEGEAYKHQDYPFHSVGPDGADRVVNSESEVPAGWTLPGGAKKAGKVKAETPKVAEAEAKEDASGTPFDAARHTGTLTKAGLWRMKVGVSRPESESVVLPLDL